MTITELMKDFIKSNKWMLIFYIVILLQIPLNNIVLPHMLGKLYENIKNKQSINIILAIIVGVLILSQAATIAHDYLEVKIHPELQKYIRERMMSHIFNESKKHYEEIEIGELITKILKLPNILYNYIDTWKSYIIPSIVLIIFAIIYNFIYNKYLGLSLLILILIITYIIVRYITKCIDYAIKRDELFSRIFGRVDDVLRNMITVLNYDTYDDEIGSITNIHLDYAENTENSLKCVINIKFMVIPLLLTYSVIYILFIYYKIQAKQITISKAIPLIIVIMLLTTNLLITIGIFKDVVMRLGIVKYSLSAFETCDMERIPYLDSPRTKKGICIQDIVFKYSSKTKDKIVFNNFNLDIEPGSKTLIVGEIGSGKSTLINLLLKFQHPQSGEIFLNGIPYNAINTSDMRRIIAYIPQNPILLNRTVYENISYGLNQSREEIEELFYKLNIHQFINNKLPDGLDTNVGKYGSKLSGGQRQIIWIIKAILIEPDIIIMDEPTSSIDESTKDIIHNLVTKIMVNKTVIMITHDPHLIQYADRIIELNNGQIIKDDIIV